MTEHEWLAATDTTPMRRFLLNHQLLAKTWRGRLWERAGYPVFSCSRRKVALFALACCRHFWDCFEGSFERPAIEAVERFIDGGLAEQVIRQTLRTANDRPSRPGGEMGPDLIELLISFSLEDVPIAYDDFLTGDVSSPFHNFLYLIVNRWIRKQYGNEAFDNHSFDLGRVAKLREELPELLRDIFGPLPFRPVVVDPGWRTSTVQLFAEGIYAEHAFDRLPLLADALIDAGCDNEDILNHLRDNGLHSKGCWPLDLLLGKE
jgi:hypothetical protein